MMPKQNIIRLNHAVAIVESDLISNRLAKAIVAASELARSSQVNPEHCRLAAKQFTVSIRDVSAAFGFLRCVHCNEYHHISAEPDLENRLACCHTLDCASDVQEAALAVFILISGLTVRPSLIQHTKWSGRGKRTARGRASPFGSYLIIER